MRLAHIFTLTLLGFISSANFAYAEGDYIPPVTDATTKAECSACHMAYPAGLLPARSWEKLMSNLNDHFGESASLPADKTAAITAYLTANAADKAGANRRVMRNLSPDQTPLRISDAPWFTRKHGEFSAQTMAKIKSVANCTACHAQAAEGYFEDD